jgi:hypothetical protein
VLTAGYAGCCLWLLCCMHLHMQFAPAVLHPQWSQRSLVQLSEQCRITGCTNTRHARQRLPG